MAWAKLSDGLDEHPKVEDLLERDEVDGLAAIGLWTLLLTQTSRRLEEGRFTRRQLVKLAPDDGERLLEHLVDVGLVDIDGRGWRIHGYMDHNPPKAEVLARRAAQSERNRIAAEKRWERERAKKAAAAAAAGQLPGQIPMPLDALTDARAHAPSDAPSHSDASAYARRHAERDAPPAMLPSRPVPSPTERERAGASGLFDSTVPPLDAIASIEGNRKFESAWITEKAEVLALVGGQPLEVQRKVAKRLATEAPRWEARGVAFFVENDWIPKELDKVKRADRKPADRSGRRDEQTADLAARAAGHLASRGQR